MPYIATGFPKTTEEIRTCFTNNMRSRGQCCECEEGWTGYGCDVPVCDPPCVQGECIDKDTCQCYDGWQGAICDDAICTDCQNGNCIAPEVCDCYYGYIEENCSRMIHTIECEHGTVTAVDKCTCDAGWTGEICDKPVCSTPCVDGWCKAPDYCEKRAKYERNDPDKVKCEYYDPNCLTCDNTQCLTCLNGHYYSTVDKMCRSCSINYDSFCITCDSTKCTECAWPRQLREVSSQQKCVTSGVIEFANPNLIFFEDSEEILIYLRCLEGCTSYDLNLDGTAPLITVDYRYHVQSLSIIEKKASTDCTFASGSTECEIRVKVFIDPFIKPDDYIIGFSLENPRGGALIGSQDYLSVYLYDIPLVSPIDSYATLNGEFNEESYKRIKIGDNNVFLIYSYLEEGQKKANEDDLFFLSVVDESWNATTNIKEFKIVDFISSAYVSDEVNKIEYTLKFSSVNYFLIYSSIPETITANFYENYELISPVYINRQLKSFPNEFTDDTEFDYSSASFTTAFVVPVTGKYKFYITVSKNSKVDFKVNSQRLLTIDNTLFATVKTGKDSTSTTTKITCGSTYLTSSCCLDTEYSEEIEDSYTAGTPLLLEFNFYHKTGKP